MNYVIVCFCQPDVHSPFSRKGQRLFGPARHVEDFIALLEQGSDD